MSENILEVKGLTKDYGDFVLDTVPIRVSKANRQSNIKLPLRIILGGSFLLCTAGNWRGTLLQCEYLTYILKAIMLLLSKAA